MKPYHRNFIKLLSIVLLITISSCKKFLEIDPPIDQIVTQQVYSSDETANSAVIGIYSKMMSGSGFASGGSLSVTLLAGRSSDEFINYYSLTSDTKQFSDNNLLPDNTFLHYGLWTEPYQIIYAANAVIENLEKSGNVSVAVKQQLNGEAKFIRALCHFYLYNLFGEVPLILTTDYKKNSIASASTKEQIYDQIIKDLIDAKNQLLENHPSNERIRANKWAASALLARVYLYHQQWANAETQASEVISQQDKYQLLGDLNSVFLKNSPEAILQFYVPAISYVNTNEGSLFILTNAPDFSTNVVLSDGLLSAFEPGDHRRSEWVGTFTSGKTSWYYPYKYKVQIGTTPRTEYSMVLRLAEQYLIRGEARTMQNDYSGARDDINKIRNRAGLGDVEYNSQRELLMAVEQERRVELFSEWGHRWLDLKRTNRADAVLGTLKSPNWKSTDVLYPIPASELINDPNLKQNKGY